MGQGPICVMQLRKTSLILAVIMLGCMCQSEMSLVTNASELVTITATANNYVPPTWVENPDFREVPVDPVYLPVLQSSESVPITGTYILRHPGTKKVCLKAVMGVEYIITQQKKEWYYNLDPAIASLSGSCGPTTAILTIAIQGKGGSLTLTLNKEGDVSFMSSMEAHLTPLPVCNGCASKSYPGLIANEKEFLASCGKSFKCNSKFLFLMATELKIKLYSLQIQAFNFPGDTFGEEVECWTDFNKRVIPIILGATAAGIILIVAISVLICRKRRSQGYERIG